MTSPDQPHFFLARQGTAHGPLSWDEIQNYLAYGSVRANDLLSLDGRNDWRKLEDWRETIEAEQNADQDALGAPKGLRRLSWFLASILSAFKSEEPKADRLRRRAVRFREWEHVPEAQRSSAVLKGIILGFLLFPPLLWSASSRVFSRHIFRPTTDEAGFLKIWPRSTETICAVLIILNAFCWAILALLFQLHAVPFIKTIIDTVTDRVGT